MSERLVGSPAFKAGGTGDPRPAGSIPVHLRHRRGTGATGGWKMKKLIVLVVLVALAVVAVRKLQET